MCLFIHSFSMCVFAQQQISWKYRKYQNISVRVSNSSFNLSIDIINVCVLFKDATEEASKAESIIKAIPGSLLSHWRRTVFACHYIECAMLRSQICTKLSFIPPSYMKMPERSHQELSRPPWKGSLTQERKTLHLLLVSAKRRKGSASSNL